MSINKFAASLVFAGILGATAAVAEQSGAFIGVQVGYGATNAEVDIAIYGPYDTTNYGSGLQSGISFRYGILGGYKQFFTENFGLRYYGVIDFGTASKHKNIGVKEIWVDNAFLGSYEEKQVSTFNINANIDALYNFISNESLDFGVFAGLSLGYTSSTAEGVAEDGKNADSSEHYGDLKASGFDLGINFGLRTNIAQNHGIELYSRFSVLEQKADKFYQRAVFYDGTSTEVSTKFKAQQLYTVGLRYTFSF